MATRDEIFISYCHKDKVWLDKLLTMLAPAKLKYWSDEKIEPGKKWKAEIEEAVRRASVGVLLVSDNFLASNFIMNEELPLLFKAATETHLTVFWIPLCHCSYHTTCLAQYQAAYNPAHPLNTLSPAKCKKALAEIGEKLKSSLPEPRPKLESSILGGGPSTKRVPVLKSPPEIWVLNQPEILGQDVSTYIPTVSYWEWLLWREESISYEGLAEWWKAYRKGAYVLFQGRTPVGSVGLWPIRRNTYESIVSGCLPETDIVPEMMNPQVTGARISYWYWGNITRAPHYCPLKCEWHDMERPACRTNSLPVTEKGNPWSCLKEVRRCFTRLLLNGTIIKWYQEHRFSAPVAVCAYEFSVAGRRLLKEYLPTDERERVVKKSSHPPYWKEFRPAEAEQAYQRALSEYALARDEYNRWINEPLVPNDVCCKCPPRPNVPSDCPVSQLLNIVLEDEEEPDGRLTHA